MLAIIAGNRREAEFYRKTLRLPPREVRHIHSLQDLAGLPKDTIYVKIGSWYALKDIDEIDSRLLARGAVEVFSTERR